jgi:predicted transcriptional regulator YdeE
MPKIEVKPFPEVNVVGLHYRGKAQAGELPQLWESINQRMGEIQSLDADAHMAFGISSMDADFPQTMEFEYIAGFPIMDTEQEQPEDMLRFTIPAGTYAAIKVPNLESIQQAYDAIYHRWLPDSGYELDLSSGNFNFELYGEEFMPEEGSQKFYIYIPVREK